MFFEERKTNENSSLFKKFNNEADKIRAWKAQAEFSLKLKDQKLSETSQTINDLRARLVQSQNELKLLNLKLQQEEEHKQDVITKNTANRELCYELKNWISRVNSQLEKAEAEKADLKSFYEGQKDLIEGLSSRFKSLSIDLEEKNNSARILIMEKDNENQGILQQLHVMTLDFQKKVDEKDAKILDLKSSVDELQNEIDTMSMKLLQCEETESELLKKLNEQSDSLEWTSTSLMSCKNKCIDLERHIVDIGSANSQLELDIKDLVQQLSMTNDENVDLKSKLESMDEVLRATKSSMDEMTVEINLVKNQLSNALDEKLAVENKRISLVEVVEEMSDEIKNYKISACEFESQIKSLNEDLSLMMNNITLLNAEVSDVNESRNHLKLAIELKSEEVAKLLNEKNQKDDLINKLMTDLDILRQSLTEAVEEKMKIDQSMKDMHADFENKLLCQEVVQRQELLEKEKLIDNMMTNQTEQKVKMQYLEDILQKDLKEIESLSNTVKNFSEEKSELEKANQESIREFDSAKNSLMEQLDCCRARETFLQQELSNTASYLASSLNKCKAEYDELLKIKMAEMMKLETEHKMENENLKREVAYYKSLSTRDKDHSGKKRGKILTRSQENLGKRDTSLEKSNRAAIQSQEAPASRCTKSLNRTSNVDFASWIDSDPIFGS